MEYYDIISIIGTRDETQYQIAVMGSILLFVLNLLFAAMLLIYLANHDYKIITEVWAAVLMLVIAFGCFMGLAILYTCTLNSVAYFNLRTVCLEVIALYLAAMTIVGLWVSLESLTDETHRQLFKLVAIPFVIEYVVYLVVVFAFYNMHPVISYQPAPQAATP
eukprot:TRINITY_DN12841_c0_g1_i4.p1 TRINITY_DN12841_c0_g1~~TRINITY_DN12841_c0_g1_i4.p1  ORF type:complete len:163 (+),score=15.72 TRINITY_DN12841_c0_g1_i4:142-630(+)